MLVHYQKNLANLAEEEVWHVQEPSKILEKDDNLQLIFQWNLSMAAPEKKQEKGKEGHFVLNRTKGRFFLNSTPRLYLEI